MSTALAFVYASILSYAVQSHTYYYDVKINTNNITNKIYTPFYGFTLDFWNNHDSQGKWNPNAGILTLDLSNPNLIALTKELSPAILRVGGSPQDSVVYDMEGECAEKYGLPDYDCSQTTNTAYYGCINKTRWHQINEFAINTNVDLIFGLNACYGRKSPSTTMNFSNIENLISYTNSMGDAAKNLLGFEFGNELNSKQHDSSNIRLDANVYGQDFYKVYEIINKKYRLLGNDGASPGYSAQVIASLNASASKNGLQAKDVMYRLTYHHYAQCEYPNGTLVFSLECLSDIIRFANVFTAVSNPAGLLSWMGEGAEHTGGGTPNVSNTFVDNFYYVYQLCTVLQNNINASLRSDLTGGDYELIDHHTFEPNPDYWILYIWKQLIGDAMYATDLVQENHAPDHTRAFAFRSKSGSGAVVAVLINFDMESKAVFSFEVVDQQNVRYASSEYYLRPHGSSLQTQLMYVNNVLMEYKDGKFPALEAVQGNGQNVTVPPAQIVFAVLVPQ